MDRSRVRRRRSLRRRDHRDLLVLAGDGPVLATRHRPGRKDAADFQRTVSHRSPPDLHAVDSPRSRDAGDDASDVDAGDCDRAHRLSAIRGAPRGNLSPQKTRLCLCGLYETRRSISTATPHCSQFMNLRLVSGLSETRILTLSQWENERFAVVNSQRTLSPVEERRARSANRARQ